mmetsp:Transcript_3898/g.6104  ORF Transcript_3898/g.6104 Transcript_3898/m.6104 type:complete len:253 (+) Transcript_3898:3-761(+)
MFPNGGNLEALLDDIARALVPRELDDVVLDNLHDPLLVFLPSMFEHVLHHIVPIRILGQARNAVENVLQQTLQLVRGAVLQQALDDPAAVHVRGHLLGLFLDRCNDEVHRIWRHLLDAFLNDMVAVHVLDASNNVLLELGSKHQLRLSRHMLDSLLDHPASIRLAAQTQELRLQSSGQDLLLLGGAYVKELLHHKVAEDVTRERTRFWRNNLEHRLLLLSISLIKLGLQEATTNLVFGEFQGVGQHLAQGNF